MDKGQEVCDYRGEYHTGRGNAVYSRERERRFNLDGRNVRRKISKLRQDGVPICSGDTGYYYAASQDEVNETVKRLNQLVTKVSNARTGLLYAQIPRKGGR
jgi:hypothetical protein